MENRLALRLCLFGGAGLSADLNASSRRFDAEGTDAECECDDLLVATGLGGFAMIASGNSAWHISHAVRSG